MHFGHCETFTMLDVDPDSRTITATTELDPPPHEPGVLPRWLHDLGTDVIIAGGMGQRAVELFSQNNIRVITGAPCLAPEDLVEQYLNNSLETGSNVCDH